MNKEMENLKLGGEMASNRLAKLVFQVFISPLST